MQLRNTYPQFLALSGLVLGLELTVCLRGQLETQQRLAILEQIRTRD